MVNGQESTGKRGMDFTWGLFPPDLPWETMRVTIQGVLSMIKLLIRS